MKMFSRCRGLSSLLLIAGMVAVATAADEGFQSLFDGRSLEGWEGNPQFWRVEDGTITGQTTKENPTSGNTFLICARRPSTTSSCDSNTASWAATRAFNIAAGKLKNGLCRDTRPTSTPAPTMPGILYEERGRGILAGRGKKVVIHEDGRLEEVGTTTDERTILDDLKKEDWNEYRIIAQGNRLVHAINGHETIEVVDNQTSKRSMSGLLALQLHAGPPMKVQFKDIQLKKLPVAAASSDSSTTAPKKIVFLAGGPSHGYGSHEHHAGCLLLARYLHENLPGYETVVHREGWPSAGLAGLEGADAIVVFCDGGGGQLLIPHLEEVNTLMDQGVGLALLHYAVEVPKGEAGDALLRWVGGYFEMNWSVNPHWLAEFKQLPEHPITRGVRPFAIEDEWYFHMRFRPQLEGVTPILSAHPPSGMNWPDGARSGNPSVRAALQRGEAQHLAWVCERPDGGRGFGFTGGHWHRNWGDDNFRKVVLNGIVWAAHGQVPEGGVGGSTPSAEELEANQDEPKPGT